REEGEPHRLARVLRQRRLEAPDRAVAIARLEPVPVALVRPQVLQPRLHRVRPPLARGDVAARDDVAEVRIGRYLEAHPARAGHLVDDREQRDAVGRRVTRQDALVEAAAAQKRRGAAWGCEGLWRDDESGTRRAAASEELAARLHGGTLRADGMPGGLQLDERLDPREAVETGHVEVVVADRSRDARDAVGGKSHDLGVAGRVDQ